MNMNINSLYIHSMIPIIEELVTFINQNTLIDFFIIGLIGPYKL